MEAWVRTRPKEGRVRLEVAIEHRGERYGWKMIKLVNLAYHDTYDAATWTLHWSPEATYRMTALTAAGELPVPLAGQDDE